MDELQALRAQIDEIDRGLVALFERRMETVLRVAEYKRTHATPILNAAREREVVERCCAQLKSPRYAPALSAFMETLMQLSKEEQQRYLADPPLF